jgi:hypothetical protein
MRWMAVAGVAAILAMTAPASAAVNFEVRFVVPCQPGDQTYTLVGGYEELCLGRETVLDGTGVVRVQRYPSIAKAVMEISQAAADRLYEATYTHVNQRLGFVFNGRLIFTPVIIEPVNIKELQLSLRNDPDDVDALVAAFPGPAQGPATAR